jgi:hypothetical protein
MRMRLFLTFCGKPPQTASQQATHLGIASHCLPFRLQLELGDPIVYYRSYSAADARIPSVACRCRHPPKQQQQKNRTTTAVCQGQYKLTVVMRKQPLPPRRTTRTRPSMHSSSPCKCTVRRRRQHPPRMTTQTPRRPCTHSSSRRATTRRRSRRRIHNKGR